MTENKRFQIIHLGNPYDFVVKDHNTNKTYGTLQGDDKSLMRLLNELNDENQELQGKYDAQKQLYCQLNSDKNNIWQDYQDLKKENEQLKQQIENLKITIEARETLIDVCEKKFKELGFIITVDDDGYVIE